MKNKKGFTLIELLAVIVIISILLLLAIPSVTTQMETSRKKAFLEDAKTILNVTRSNYESEAYYNDSNVVSNGNETKYSMETINGLLKSKLTDSPFNSLYKDAEVIVAKAANAEGDDEYNFYVCLIDEEGNGIDFTSETNLDLDSVSTNNKVSSCSVLPNDRYLVRVVVNGGVIDGENRKYVSKGESTTFKVEKSNVDSEESIVNCNNNQNATLTGTTLSVNNITSNTTCTVTFTTAKTVLYNDGTLIINEKSSNRNANVSTHGNVVKEYGGMSDSNSYVFSLVNRGDYDGPNYPWYNEVDKIKRVEIGQVIKPVSTAHWFDGLLFMNYGDFRNLDTSNVTDMNHMFTYTGNSSHNSFVEKANFGSAPTPSQLAELITVDYVLVGLNTWNTSKVTDMSYMFASSGYDSLNIYDIGNLSNWDTSKVTDMSYMFYSVGFNIGGSEYGFVAVANQSSVDKPMLLSNDSLNNAKVGANSGSFVLTGLNNWNVSHVTNMKYMFSNCGYKARTWSIGNLSNWNTSSVVDMQSMFSESGFYASTWSVGNLSNWNTSSVEDMGGLFRGAGAEATTWSVGNLSSWNTSKVKNMNYMFWEAGYCASTFTLGDLSNWDVSNVVEMVNMFGSAGYSASTWNVGSLKNWNVSNVKDFSYMFYFAAHNANSMNLDLSNWDTSNVTNMQYMFSSFFQKAEQFSLGNISNWNTSKVQYMNNMFSDAGYNSSRFDINVSNWDTSKVKSMRSMFGGTGLNSDYWSIGNLSSWDTSKVDNMDSMFNHAGQSASTFNSIGTLKVYNANVDLMFSGCATAKATISFYGKPTISSASNFNPFYNAATASGSLITVNYSNATTNIDDIMGSVNSGSNVVKGSLLS